MPIYEYLCAGCGKHFEVTQKMSDAPLTVCESCGGKLEKQVSLGAILTKGDAPACPAGAKSCCPGCTHNHH